LANVNGFALNSVLVVGVSTEFRPISRSVSWWCDVRWARSETSTLYLPLSNNLCRQMLRNLRLVIWLRCALFLTIAVHWI